MYKFTGTEDMVLAETSSGKCSQVAHELDDYILLLLTDRRVLITCCTSFEHLKIKIIRETVKNNNFKDNLTYSFMYVFKGITIY